MFSELLTNTHFRAILVSAGCEHWWSWRWARERARWPPPMGKGDGRHLSSLTLNITLSLLLCTHTSYLPHFTFQNKWHTNPLTQNFIFLQKKYWLHFIYMYSIVLNRIFTRAVTYNTTLKYFIWNLWYWYRYDIDVLELQKMKVR